MTFLVGWAFNVAASANLPALVMLLFWKRTTKQGITAAILVGMISSLAWMLLSAQAYRDVYGLPAETGARARSASRASSRSRSASWCWSSSRG